jgi:hypothetical protein
MTDITTPQPPATERAAEQAAGVAPTGKDQAASVAATAKDQAAIVASTAADQARAVASEAAAEAKDVFADARQQLRAQADEQSTKLASLIGDIGGQLRTMARAGDSGPAKDVIATVAEQAEGISQRLRDGGIDRTLDDARRLARNHPGLFLAGAALAGFVAARVARTVDTSALKQAADPTQGTNGSRGQPQGLGSTPDLALEAVPPAAAQRPLVADPPASTGTVPATGAPR